MDAMSAAVAILGVYVGFVNPETSKSNALINYQLLCFTSQRR